MVCFKITTLEKENMHFRQLGIFHICQKINTISLLRVSTLCRKCALDLCVWFCFVELVQAMVLWHIYTCCYAQTITWCVNDPFANNSNDNGSASMLHFRTGMLFIGTWRHAGLQFQIPEVKTLLRSRWSCCVFVCLSHGVKLPQSSVYGTCAEVITLISYFPSIPLIPFSPLWEEAAGKALVQ